MQNQYFQPGADPNSFTPQTTPARSTNTNFVISTLYGAFVSYSPRLSATVSRTLSGSATSTATCELQIRPTPGSGSFTTIAQVRVSASSTYTLLIGISVSDTNANDMVLAGFVPAGYEVRLNVTTAGTASVTMSSQPQQETLYI